MSQGLYDSWKSHLAEKIHLFLLILEKKPLLFGAKKMIVKLQTLLFPVLLRTVTVPYESDCRLVCSTDKHTKNPNIYFF